MAMMAMGVPMLMRSKCWRLGSRWRDGLRYWLTRSRVSSRIRMRMLRWRRHMLGRRIWLILLESVPVRAIVNHLPLWWCILRLRVGVFDGIQHRIEDMRSDDDIAASNFGHGLLRRILALDQFPFRLFWLRPVSLQDAVAQPFFRRSFQGCEEDRTVYFQTEG